MFNRSERSAQIAGTGKNAASSCIQLGKGMDATLARRCAG